MIIIIMWAKDKPVIANIAGMSSHDQIIAMGKWIMENPDKVSAMPQGDPPIPGCYPCPPAK
jgi:hypothetical protein